MIFCEQCGNKLNEGAKFCGKCGTPVAAGQAETHEMSAPAACTQCGTPLAEGEMFCANCGAKVGAVPQQQSAPAQAQEQAVSDEVLREGLFELNKFDKGKLSLYRDRLEWKGEFQNIVIPLNEIVSIKVTAFRVTDVIVIKMVNAIKYELVDLPKKITWTYALELHSWVADIKSLCPHLR